MGEKIQLESQDAPQHIPAGLPPKNIPVAGDSPTLKPKGGI